MKPRLFLLFALMVLMGISMAAVAVAEPAVSTAAPVVDASPSTASFLCNLNKSVTPAASSQSAKAEIPGLTPTPMTKAGTCGSCSLSPCVGATNGVTVCRIGTTGWGHCEDVYGDVCSDGTLKCQCWSGPLP